MLALNRDLGQLDALGSQLKDMTASMAARMWEPGLMLLCAEIGQHAQARVIFSRLLKDDCRAISRDEMYVTCLVFCAETCGALADAAGAESLYRKLRHYAGQTANHPTAVCFGAVDLYLGTLTSVANWPEIAGEHFERALTLNRAMRAWPSLARTHLRYGTLLMTLPSEEARRLGLQQLRDAEQLARRFGMARLVADVASKMPTPDLDVTYPDELTAREIEVLRLRALGQCNGQFASASDAGRRNDVA